mmetsp:Transcript_117761/g.380020  ORF Transcript_117761/g.380020 Transcript_117761/m.380020 type:complete len:419 (-) Transcript_117761:1304-2560(-)
MGSSPVPAERAGLRPLPPANLGCGRGRGTSSSLHGSRATASQLGEGATATAWGASGTPAYTMNCAEASWAASACASACGSACGNAATCAAASVAACAAACAAAWAVAMSVSSRFSSLARRACTLADSLAAVASPAALVTSTAAARTSAASSRCSSRARPGGSRSSATLASSALVTAWNCCVSCSAGLLSIAARLRSTVSRRRSSRAATRSVACQSCAAALSDGRGWPEPRRRSTNSFRSTVAEASPDAVVVCVLSRSKTWATSAFSRPLACESSAAQLSSSRTFCRSSLLRSWPRSAPGERKMSRSARWRLSCCALAPAASRSCACLPVTAIIFSLTTPVMIDSTAHEDTTMNATQKNLLMGITSKRGSRSLMSALMTLKSTYMDSTTLGKILATCQGAWPPKSRPCPMSITQSTAQT